MSTTTFTVDAKVEKIGSPKDYTTGRKGHRVEVDQEAGRARVMWTQERNGSPIKMRTWVRFQALMVTTG